jgi:hypothetical protein
MKTNKYTDLSSVVQDKLDASGLKISKSIVEVVLSSYIEAKREEFLKGNSVYEKEIGVESPSWRRVSNQFTTEPFVSKINVKLDNSMRDKMNSQLGQSPEYRMKVGAQEL